MVFQATKLHFSEAKEKSSRVKRRGGEPPLIVMQDKWDVNTSGFYDNVDMLFHHISKNHYLF
jgi:hypothetical protein